MTSCVVRNLTCSLNNYLLSIDELNGNAEVQQEFVDVVDQVISYLILVLSINIIVLLIFSSSGFGLLSLVDYLVFLI